MYQIPSLFNDFISLNCDRMGFITSYLNARGIDTAIFPINNKNHIYVKFPKEQYDSSCKIKTVLAHYDRVQRTPGANDNSASVFCLMEWAAELIKMNKAHNIRLIFTDGEELGQNGVNEQGAFELAALFKRLKITNDDVFVFDCTGRGTVPVICESHFPKNISPVFMSKYSDLEARLQKILTKASGGKWYSLFCNYSDNAGFIVNGIPAVAVTFLPSDEISMAVKGEIPKTWSLFHTMNDNLESLMPESFELMKKILFELAKMKTF